MGSAAGGKPFGELLRSARLAAGMTQEDLAARSGLSVRAISDLERDRTRRPYFRSVRLLADALGIANSVRAQLLQAASQAQQHGHRRQNAEPAAPPEPGGRPRAPTAGAGPAGRRTPPAPEAFIPRQLPAGVPHFAGREAELNMLTSLLSSAASGGTVVISAIGGMAGVGKTALAIHWAHQVAGQFPDGQLYVNLHGFGPWEDPVEPAAAVRGFLDALGVPAQRIPAGPQAQAGLYRSLVAGKQMLIVLDNARDEEQVRPLLPASPACLVVVTSRTQLAGLAAADGAHLVTLDVLSAADSYQLLARRLGTGPLAAEPGAVTELIGLCGRLPLALAITAARAASHGFPLAVLAAELGDEHTRLDTLTAGDPATSVKAVFSWSYQHLTPATARMFRLLSLHPGADITPHAVAVLTALHLDQARDLLREMVRAHLLTEPSPGRYAFHDLLRAYARRRCEALDGEDERRVALTRLFDYYLAAAGAAVDTLSPGERQRRPRVSLLGTPLPLLDTQSSARGWLDAERATLVAVARHTAAHGWPSHTTRLAAILFRYLDLGGHYSDTVAVCTHALHAAEQTGDHAGQANALKNRSAVDYWQGRYRQAASQLRRALALYRELGDRIGQARTLGNLGAVLYGQAQYQSAGKYFRQALALAREVGDRFGQAINLGHVGLVLCRQGRYEQAAKYHQQSLALCRELGDRWREAGRLDDLGVVLRMQGRHQEAQFRHQQALAICREFADRCGEAEALDNLGTVLCCQGQHELAIGRHQQALAIFRDMGNRQGEAEALSHIGEALTALDQARQARARHYEALGPARQIGNPHLEARSHDGLACTYHTTGDLAQARHHWKRALELYRSLDVPEAEHTRAKLNSLNGTPS